MTKTGKLDSYWRDICIKYAQGQYHFSTDKHPGAKKWKKALENIDACPLQSHTKDLFGRSLLCFCGFHKPADLSSAAGSTKAGEVEAEAGRGEETQRQGVETQRQGEETRRQEKSETTQSQGEESRRQGEETQSQGEETRRADTEAGASVAGQGVQCYKCNELVEGEKFSEHLSDHHTEERCDTCGAKVQGWRCNAVHTQMYMLEGASRWNMGRAKEAVAVEGASTLRTFDVQLMSHLNNMSQRVLGCALVPEFTPPGKPTGERIAVEYLLAQTNRGDLLAPKQMPEIPSQVLEEDEDEPNTTVCMPGDLGAGDPWDEAEPDATLCQSAELEAGDPNPPSAVEDQVLLEGDTEPGPLVTEQPT
ncbi:hypothetical protein INR49_011475 [Caranx melampygus]|nr:hypothetical protein INR49_011475 [Caranx melampygus]